MSFQAMAWAVAQETKNAGQKLVLIMLANYCNSHTGQCNPSHKRLAHECCMGISTLKRHLEDLEKSGLLQVVQNIKNGGLLSNQYVLNLDGGVSPNWTKGQPKLGGGVSPNRATNLEDKPVNEPKPPTPQGECVGFENFWESWPRSERKVSKGKCLEVWKRKQLDTVSEQIIRHVNFLKTTESWTKNDGAFIPAPLVYINQRRWEGAELDDNQPQDKWAGAI